MTRGSALLGAIAAAGVLAAILAAAGASGAPRAIVALPFLLIGPGLAWVRLLRLDDPMTELALAVTVNLALEAIVATALLVTGLWSPGLALAMMVAITLAASAAAFARRRNGPASGDAARAVDLVAAAEQGEGKAGR
jgi:uncharacterized membrane protein